MDVTLREIQQEKLAEGAIHLEVVWLVKNYRTIVEYMMSPPSAVGLERKKLKERQASQPKSRSLLISSRKFTISGAPETSRL